MPLSPPSDEFDAASVSELLRLHTETRAGAARKAAQEKDILRWGKLCFPDKFPIPFCADLHEYFVSIRHAPRTNTRAPREHAKTIIRCFLIPLFQALEEPGEYEFCLNVQATDDKGEGINRTIQQELEENEVLHLLYGNQITPRWTKGEFQIKKGGIFKGVGVGRSIRGVQYNGKRPSYIVADDIYDEDDLHNAEATQKKTDWFWSTLYPARNRSRKNSVHVQGTAINLSDIYCKLDEDPRWTSKTFSCFLPSGAALWPELALQALNDSGSPGNLADFAVKELEADRRSMGSVIFEREQENKYRDDATSIIKKAWLYPPDAPSWEYDPAKELKFDRHLQLVEVSLGFDPSVGEKVQNDFSAGALLYWTQYEDAEGCEFWIVALWNQHLSQDKRILLLQAIHDAAEEQHPLTQANLEAIGAFQDFSSEAIRRTTLPIVEIKTVKDKMSRLEGKSSLFENGKVHLNKNIDPELKDMLTHQLTTNAPKHDDIRDALLLALDKEGGQDGKEWD